MKLLPTPIPSSFKITDQYVWLPELYTLPAQISYDVICGNETDEFIPCFSFTRAQWDSPECDALSWYASPHTDYFTFRTNLFEIYPTVERLSAPFKPTVGVSFKVSCNITSTSATYAINGVDYAKATYKQGDVPIQGYFGFAIYDTENITVKNVSFDEIVLSIKLVTDFELIWWDKGSGGKSSGSFWRPKLPEGYFALGHYGQSDYGIPNSDMIVVKPVDGVSDAIARPLGFQKIWDDSGSGADMNGSFWLPTPPSGYAACGVVAMDSHNQPSVNEIMCIREDLVVSGKLGDAIWLDIGTGANQNAGTWYLENKNHQGVNAKTFFAQASHSKPSGDPLGLSCLNRSNIAMPQPLSLNELNDIIKKYAPSLNIHPDEKYKPTSVDFFVENSNLLDKRTGQYTQAHIDDLPQGEDNGSNYQLVLKSDSARSGDFSQATCYVHAKAGTGLYTDIQFWFFYAYNGHGTFRIKTLSFGQTLTEGNTSSAPIGEHEGDWEHVTVRINNFTHQPEYLYLSQHGGGIWVPWKDLTFVSETTQPIIYSSQNGHASYQLIGSNYSHHIKKPNTNWSPAIIEFFLVNQTKPNGDVLNCAEKYCIINADYLGDKAPAQPNWVDFWGRWGKSSEAHLTVEQVEMIILKNAAPLLGVLGPASTAIIAAIAGIIVPFLNVEDQDGPTAPIAKPDWSGNE